MNRPLLVDELVMQPAILDRMQRPQKWVSLALIFLAAFLIAAMFMFAEVMLTARSQALMPNDYTFPMVEFWPMFKLLLTQDAWEAWVHLLKEPVFEAGFWDANEKASLWRIYFFVPSIVAHLAASFALVVVLLKMRTNNIVLASFVLLFGVALIVLPTTYVNLVAHCSGPTWLIDVWLRATQSPFNEMSSFWLTSPISAMTTFRIMQWTMLFTGAAVLVVFHLRQLRLPPPAVS